MVVPGCVALGWPALRSGNAHWAWPSMVCETGDLALGGDGLAMVEESLDWHALCSY
jgi:hypothetical protein